MAQMTIHRWAAVLRVARVGDCDVFSVNFPSPSSNQPTSAVARVAQAIGRAEGKMSCRFHLPLEVQRLVC